MTPSRLRRGNVSLHSVVVWSSAVMTMAFGVILWRFKVKTAPPPEPTEDQRRSRIVEVSDEQLAQLAASRNSRESRVSEQSKLVSS
jgi:hypothetical protein